MKNRNN